MKIVLLFLFCLICVSSKAQLEIIDGTYSERTDELGNPTLTFFDMTPWDSSPYLEYHLTDNGNYLINFRILLPNNYTPTKNYPTILMLHGKGESGVCRFECYEDGDQKISNNDHQLYHGGLQHLKAVENGDFPGIVIFPQNDRDWHPEWLERVFLLLEKSFEKWSIDKNRLYVHGLSAGGKATWEIVNQRPDLFAAYLPMSGLTDVDFQRLAPIPVWLFQGELDVSPQLDWAEGRIEQLKNAGGKPRFTVYENIGHAVWNIAYNEGDFFSWMLEQSKLNLFVFGEVTEFCSKKDISTQLALSPGFEDYQWRRGPTILNNNDSILLINEFGTYTGRFKRNGNWSEWSNPVTIKKITSNEKPVISFNGSLHLPSLEQISSQTLSVNQTFDYIKWNTGSTSKNIEVSSEGYYAVQTRNSESCNWSTSDSLYITINKNPSLNSPEDAFTAAIDNNSLQIFWVDNNQSETGYEIYRSENINGPYQLIFISSENEESFIDNDLKPNQQYIYKIRAINHKEVSRYTEAILGNTTLDDTNQSIPTGVKVIFKSTDSMIITWDKILDDEVVEYELYINEKVYVTSDTAITIENLTHGENYRIRVRSKDESGNYSEFSAQLTEPLIVTGLYYDFYAGDTWDFVNEFLNSSIYKSGSTENIDITIKNEFYPDNDYFAFAFRGYLYIEQEGNYTFHIASDDGSMLYIDNNLVINNDGLKNEIEEKSGQLNLTSGAHYIEVYFFERTGNEYLKLEYEGPGITKQSIPSELFTSMMNSQNYSLETPEMITISSPEYNKVSIGWIDNSAGETNFEIFRSLNDISFEKIAEVEANVSSFLDSGLTGNTKYFYKVRAINRQTESDFSNNLSTITPEQPLPGSITLEEVSHINNSTLKLQWEIPDDPDFSQIEIFRSDDNQNFKLVRILSNKNVEYYDSSLSANQEYFYRIRTLKNNLKSNYSQTLSGITQNAFPIIDEPDPLEMNAFIEFSYIINVVDIDKDSIRFTAELPDFINVESYTRNQMQLSIYPEISDIGLYKIGIAVNDGYDGMDKDTLEITVNQGPLSIEDEQGNNPVVVYPNPFFDGLIFIKSKYLQGSIEIKIINTLGKVVYQNIKNSFNHLEIDLSSLSRGVYTLTVSSKSHKYSHKIIKQ